MTDSTFEHALALALSLSPGKRLELIEQVASSLKQELPAAMWDGEHWGEALNRLLDSLEMGDWATLETDDPVDWLKRQRTEERQRRLGDWGSE